MQAKAYDDAVFKLNKELHRQREINRELFDALENMLDAVRQNIDGKPPTADQIFAKAGNQAVAAIAKATGSAE